MLHRRIPQSFLSFFDGLLCSRVIQLLSALPGAFYAKSSRHQLCKHLISPLTSPPPTEQPPIYSICRRRYRVVDIIFKSKNIKEIYLILNCLCFLVKSLSAQTHCFLPFTDSHCRTTSLDKDFVSLSTFSVSEVNRLKSRPHSVSFLGKETDTATPLRLENFGRIDFSLGRWITRGKKTPKSMTPYAKVPGELVRIFFHSLLWPQRSLLYGLPPNCTKQSVFLTLQLGRICQKIEFHICQQCVFFLQ